MAPAPDRSKGLSRDRARPAARGGPDARVCVGAIAGAFGVRGEARLKPFTAAPEDIAAYGPVETEDGARRFEVTVTRAIKGGLAARLSGVGTKEEADALRGQRLYVPRAALPEPEEEESYYHADLIGLRVVDPGGAELGRVTAVLDHGAGDLLEVAPPADAAGGKRPAKVLLPFTREAAPLVDVSGGKIVADPPAGLFEEAEGAGEPEPEPEPRSDQEAPR